jgi:uncharacterized protein YuzE
MRIVFDRKGNQAYIELVPPSQVPGGKSYECSLPHIPGRIHLDFDKTDHLIGIEVLGATRILPDEVLKKAERI